MALTPTLTPTKVTLNADPARIGVAVKLNVPVVGHDATGKLVNLDLAELDDASAQAWLMAVKDWKKKLFYRQLLSKHKAGAKV